MRDYRFVFGFNLTDAANANVTINCRVPMGLEMQIRKWVRFQFNSDRKERKVAGTACVV